MLREHLKYQWENPTSQAAPGRMVGQLMKLRRQSGSNTSCWDLGEAVKWAFELCLHEHVITCQRYPTGTPSLKG